MIVSEVHDMELTRTSRTGVKIYDCPDCGRRLALYSDDSGPRKTVYKEGNPGAMHRAGKWKMEI